MIYLLSPAKALDFESAPRQGLELTTPRFVRQASELIDVLKAQSPAQVASLMKLSDKLAGLNVARYQAWRAEPEADRVRAAALAFNGDVYKGLDAPSLSDDELRWLQQHVCILSGLYGVLRPLDALQPYRLEMGTRLKTAAGSNLYQLWGTRIADYLNERLAAADEAVVVNLASQEYFRAVDREALKARVVDCVFEDHKSGKYKVISFYAKRARGLMARWAAQQRVQTVDQLQDFDGDGYAFAAGESQADRLVFRRRLD